MVSAAGRPEGGPQAEHNSICVMKVRDVIKMIRNDGWFMLPRTGTSHRQFKHSAKPGRVTVAGHASDEVDPKTLKSIKTQAGIK